MRVRFAPAGRRQFLAVIAHIAEERPLAAARFLARAKRSLRRLARYPNSGRRIPAFPDLPFRELVLSPYRFFYRTEGQVVWIVAVWHSAQLPDQPNERGGA
jgi:plasmid stabilization system protein ParE